MQELSLSPQSFDFHKLNIRPLGKIELDQIDFEYQSGMEFISWYYEFGDTVTYEELVKGLSVVLDVFSKGIEFPVAEYNNYRDVTNVLGFTFGEILRKEFRWEWFFADEFDKGYGGYTIVSPNRRLGIITEELFYDRILYNKNIQFPQIYYSIKNGDLAGKDATSFQFYEPWNAELSKQ